MFLRPWTAVLFTLWACDPGHSQQESGSSRICDIKPNPEPQYVVAYRMHYRPGRGCFCNSSSPSHQLVHVINLKLRQSDADVTSRKSVNLKIEPKDFSTSDSAADDKNSLELHQRMLVFVLNSDQPVKWKVEISRKFQSHTQQLFLVQSHSTVRFKKRKVRVHMRGRRRNMPSANDERAFLSWVKRRFQAVTSYSEVDGDKLLFYVGQANVTTSECRLNEMKPSPYAMIAHMDKQPVVGCTTPDSKSIMRPTYIIELLNVSEGDILMEPRVELDIMPARGQKIEQNFNLVLHSSQSIKWVLRSHHVQGWIDVVTDADVDLKGIRMHTVALRRELIEPSGLDLIHWAEYYITPVKIYASVASANILQLHLPTGGLSSRNLSFPEDISQVLNPSQKKTPSNDLRENLKHIIKTQCEGGVMEVSLPTILTQARELDLPLEQMSLLDHHCQATTNKTHVIIRTALDQCKTRKITLKNEYIYSNAIVIHASGMVGAILEEELGSGYFDLQATSGSGWMEPDEDKSDTTYVDDEDFTSHTVQIDVECRLSRSDSANSNQNGDVKGNQVVDADTCNMQVYDDPLFLRHVVHFPYTSSASTGIYIQAFAPSDPKVHVLMESCWVTRSQNAQENDKQQKVFIQQGCTRMPCVSWIPRGHSEIRPERLWINCDLPVGSYLHCQLAMCYKDSSNAVQKCPPDPSVLCNSNVLPNMYPRVQKQPCGVHTIGPLEVTHGEMHIIGDVSSTRSSRPASSSGVKAVQDLAHPQQSVIIEGLDSGTVVGIAFAAFAIGILLTGALWFIHTHTGPSKRGMSAVSMVGTSGEVTPNSSSPISA